MTDKRETDRWLRLAVATPAAMVEAVSDLLTVLSEGGVEIGVEKGGLVEVAGFFLLTGDPDRVAAPVLERLGEIFALYGEPLPEPGLKVLADQDWATAWQHYFKPLEIVRGLVIKPSWEEFQPDPGTRVIEMDPGQAFGTGQHESTRLALELVRARLRERTFGRALDVGTGTGILAMGVATLAGIPVEAIDNDPTAVEAATANVRANRLEDLVRVSATPLAALPGPYPLIMANIVHDVLAAMVTDFARLLPPGGVLVLAGLLRGWQEDNMTRLCSQAGLAPLERRSEGEWVALALARQ